MDSLDEDRDRILACINACAGLNPEAVPKLVEACRKIVACYEQRDGRIMHEMWEGHFIAPRRFAAARAIKDALDLAEKTE